MRGGECLPEVTRAHICCQLFVVGFAGGLDCSRSLCLYSVTAEVGSQRLQPALRTAHIQQRECLHSFSIKEGHIAKTSSA